MGTDVAHELKGFGLETAPVQPSNPGQTPAEKKYRGIQKSGRKFGATIRDPTNPASGTRGDLWLGTFDTREEAAAAYDDAARRIHGADAKCNFPPVAPPGAAPDAGAHCQSMWESSVRIILLQEFCKSACCSASVTDDEREYSLRHFANDSPWASCNQCHYCHYTLLFLTWHILGIGQAAQSLQVIAIAKAKHRL